MIIRWRGVSAMSGVFPEPYGNMLKGMTRLKRYFGKFGSAGVLVREWRKSSVKDRRSFGEVRNEFRQLRN